MYMAPFQIDCPLELHNGNMLSSCDSNVGKTLVLEGHVKGLLCIPLYKLEWIFFSVVFGPSLFKHAKNQPGFVICGLCPINLPWILHFCTQYLIAAFFLTMIHWGRELLSFWIWIDVQLQLSFERSTSIDGNIRMENNCRVRHILIQDYFQRSGESY